MMGFIGRTEHVHKENTAATMVESLMGAGMEELQGTWFQNVGKGVLVVLRMPNTHGTVLMNCICESAR